MKRPTPSNPTLQYLPHRISIHFWSKKNTKKPIATPLNIPSDAVKLPKPKDAAADRMKIMLKIMRFSEKYFDDKISRAVK
jgi:hypothetical protein